MHWSYLTTDVKGSYSKIIYGEQGDKVAPIGRINEMIKVLHENGQIFFVKEHLLSNEFINKKQKDESKESRKSPKKRI